MAEKPTYEELEKRILELEQAESERKRAEEALEKRIHTVTTSADDADDIAFEDLFDLNDIQRLQDEFAQATGVASMIMHLDGTPITRPSNFSRLCSEIIRKTEKGRRNCQRSDATIGDLSFQGLVIRPCFCAGLWDAGAAISVGGQHIANWMIGQVRDDTQTEDQIRAYAREIGADEEVMVEAFLEVPSMSREQFEQIARLLFTLANQLSGIAYQNVQQRGLLAKKKQVEEALKENEAYLRTLIRTIPDLVWMKDSEGTYLLCNARFERFFGAKEKDIVGKTDYDFVDRELADFFREHDKLAMDKGGPSINEEEVSYADDGHREILETIKTPIYKSDGRLAGVLGIGRDITERKQAEVALATREHEFRTLAENLPDNIVRHDREGRVVYVNPVFEKVLGAVAADIIGSRVGEFYTDGSYEVIAQAVDAALASGENGEVEFIVPVPSKEPIVHQIRMIPERDKYGEVTGVLSIGRDITERKRAEQARQANLRFFENMDRVNRAMQGADDLEEMMKNVLEIVLSVFDCDRAFLMHPCDPKAASWRVPVECTKSEYPGAFSLGLEMRMDKEFAGTLQVLLDTDGAVLFGSGKGHPLPKDVSEQFGFQSKMAVALYPRVGKPWQFGIHQCSHPRVWEPEKVKLFKEIGRRLADGLTAMLTYRDLRESEEFLNNVVENIPNMIFVKDAKDLRIVRFNKAGEELLGYSRQDLIGKNDYDFFPKEKADFFTSKDREVLKSKTFLDISEEDVLTRSGEKRILQTKKLPILDGSGKPKFLLGISEDITERKRAEEKLQEASLIINQSPAVAFIWKNEEGWPVEFVSENVKDLFGYTEEEFRSSEVVYSNIIHPDDLDRVSGEVAQAGLKKDSNHFTHDPYRIITKDGAVKWLDDRTFIHRDENGKIIHYQGVVLDITERKKLEDQLRQAQKMESVGRLAGGVAHDFNNMLGVILGNTEMALEEVSPDQTIFDDLQEIRKAAQRSVSLTRQLLGFARKQTVAPKVLDMNEIVSGMLKMLRPLIGEDIDLLWLPGEGVWPVNIDHSQVDQILANLCVNARDAIADVGKITIETENTTLDEGYCAEHPGFIPGDFVMLAVSDDGNGMDKETMNRVFEPFFTTKELGEGTGLGLATVYGIVKQNDGFINVYSEPGQGASFKIYLPRYKSKTGQMKQESSAVPATSGHETILLVEDEPAIQKVARQMLERLGYQVLVASTPGEAIRMAREHNDEIHLLLSDVIMPEMNGRDLAKNIITLFPGIKRLFMSGYTANVIAHHGVLEEGINFLQKPFSRQALATKVREVLDHNSG